MAPLRLWEGMHWSAGLPMMWSEARWAIKGRPCGHAPCVVVCGAVDQQETSRAGAALLRSRVLGRLGPSRVVPSSAASRVVWVLRRGVGLCGSCWGGADLSCTQGARALPSVIFYVCSAPQRYVGVRWRRVPSSKRPRVHAHSNPCKHCPLQHQASLAPACHCLG